MRTHPTARRIASASLIAASLSASVLTAQESKENRKDAAPRGPRGPQVVSPEVAADGKITFRIVASAAKSVRLAGGDIPAVGRGLDLKQGENGVWEVSVTAEPGAYRYRFDVDGVPVLDPRNPMTSESQGNPWSLVAVPGTEFADVKDVPRGAVAEVTYRSKALGRFRRMHVYTPPGYESGTGTYPTFYLLHGASDSDNSWSSVGRAGFILDNLIAAGKAKPMVVVMPAGHAPRPEGEAAPPADAPRDRRRDPFLEDFVQDILPYIEKTYRVHKDRRNRAIAGLSMGGAQTLNLLVRLPDTFGHAGVFSSGVFGIAGGRRGGDQAAPQGPSWEEQNKAVLDGDKLKGIELIWFGTGKDDFLVETSRKSVEMLKSHGLPVTYEETGGGHTWLVWRDYLGKYAPMLFKTERVAGIERAKADERPAASLRRRRL